MIISNKILYVIFIGTLIGIIVLITLIGFELFKTSKYETCTAKVINAYTHSGSGTS